MMDGRSSAFPGRRAAVLADITHELGNFFHRLYYCSDLVREQASPPPGGVGEMLTRTIGGLQGFLACALEYLGPIEIAPVRMSASDIVSGLAAQLRATLPSIPVEVATSPESATPASMVDPARFSTVAQVIARQVATHGGVEGAIAVSVATATGDGAVALAVSILGAHRPSAVAPAPLASLEWSLAELIVNQHGGELQLGGEPDAPTVLLRLPVASS